MMKTQKQRLLWPLLILFIACFILMASIQAAGGKRKAGSQSGATAVITAVDSSTSVNPTLVNASLINDGSFENSPTAWVEETNAPSCGSSIGNFSSVFGISPFNGNQYFWAGGVCDTTPVSNSAGQMIIVPGDAYTLSFWYYLERIDADSPSNDDFAYAKINGNVVWQIDMVQENNTGEWIEAIIDLSDYAGSSILLEFGAVNDSDTGVGNALFDYITFSEPPTIMATIDAELGGMLTYVDPQGLPTTIVVPAGAVTETIALTYKPLPALDPSQPLPPDLLYANHGFDLNAQPELIYLPAISKGATTNIASSIVPAPTSYQTTGTTQSLSNGFIFLRPVTVTVTYSDEDIIGINEGNLRLYYYIDGIWVDAVTTCPDGRYTSNPQLNIVQLPVCHLTRFGLVGN